MLLLAFKNKNKKRVRGCAREEMKADSSAFRSMRWFLDRLLFNADTLALHTLQLVSDLVMYLLQHGAFRLNPFSSSLSLSSPPLLMCGFLPRSGILCQSTNTP